MGRYYNGDIDGKFWFAVQSSNDADFFGVEGTPRFLDYYFDEAKKEMFAFGKLKYKTENQDVVMKKILKDRHPTSKCLNFLDFEEALNVWKEFA